MKSAFEVHVDFVRLLEGTERLVSAGEPPSADGTWEHWPRFCQFLSSLGDLRCQLQARVAETPRDGSPAPPSPEELADYDRRLEVLRRNRDDLASAAAAAAAAKRRSSAAENTPSREAHQATAANVNTGAAAAEEEKESSTTGTRSSSATIQNNPRTASLPRKGTEKEAAAGLFSGRQDGGRGNSGRSGSRLEAEEAEADHVAQEISSMAGRLKESSMAINQTLRAQTQVLEDTGDAATQNVDRVKRENVRVTERLRKKRAAMIVSWCMMISVVVIFFATYALVILPFEKRRGPFVPHAFAQATEQSARSTPQSGDKTKHNGGGGMGAPDDAIRRAQQSYQEAARQARSRQASDNAGHRIAREQMEASRERQAKRMMDASKERHRAAKDEALKRQKAAAEIDPQQLEEEKEGQEEHEPTTGTCSAPPPDDTAGAGAGADVSAEAGSCTSPPANDEEVSATEEKGASAVAHNVDPADVRAQEEDRRGGRHPHERPTGQEEEDASPGSARTVSEQDQGLDKEEEGAGDQTESAKDMSGVDKEVGEGERGERMATSSAVNTGAGAGDPEDAVALSQAQLQAEAARRLKERAQVMYAQKSQQTEVDLATRNEGLRMVAEEKERYRERESIRMMERARNRRQQEVHGDISEREGVSDDQTAAPAPETNPGAAAAVEVEVEVEVEEGKPKGTGEDSQADDVSDVSVANEKNAAVDDVSGLDAVRMRLRDKLARKEGGGSQEDGG